MAETAVFEFFVRKLPAQRNFSDRGRTRSSLDFLKNVRFAPAELDWIAGHGAFRSEFVSYLEKFRFCRRRPRDAGGDGVFPQ
jgi:nicotinate phosphoribosyltransferase